MKRKKLANSSGPPLREEKDVDLLERELFLLPGTVFRRNWSGRHGEKLLL